MFIILKIRFFKSYVVAFEGQIKFQLNTYISNNTLEIYK